MAILQSQKPGWLSFWFQDKPTTVLEIIRIGVAALLLINYALLPTHDLLALYGEQGIASKEALQGIIDNPWKPSVLFFINEPWQFFMFHTALLFSCLALLLGWHAPLFKWLVLLGHISLINRNPYAVYGVDYISAGFLLILCLAPIGKGLSLDRLRNARKLKKQDLTAVLPVFTSEWGFACLRLMQIQMAILFFFSGVEKLYGDSWWYGNAIWIAITNHQTSYIPVDFFADHYWIINIATYSVIILELAYLFLIWGEKTRPYILSCAIVLHLGFVVFLGLYFFGFMMIVGHLAFFQQQWLNKIYEAWKNRIGPMEIIYDGDCGFCKRSMAWLLAFDGLNQITLRDYRTNPSPVVASDKVNKALYVVPKDLNAIAGFDAYRFVVVRVPGLWWLVPFFYVPIFSRLIGRPAYALIASNRDKISSCMVDTSKSDSTVKSGA